MAMRTGNFTRAGLIVSIASLLACGEGSTRRVRVTIPSGASVAVAAESLAKHGVISFPRLFRAYASITGGDRRLQPGTYLLRRSESYRVVLRRLVEGRGLVNTVTIPEGWEISDIVPALARAASVPAESLEAAVRDTELVKRAASTTGTLEGYLFPETYVFSAGASALQIVRSMLVQFERRWKPEWDARLDSLKMTRHQIITLASIIEKEARLAEERPVISAVYHNRLRIGMALQADPTVQYALGEHKARVMERDLAVKSPYNTYQNPGLPPGPIASPGAASIEAALFPANVPYLYFVAHPDGHHEFRRTYREHSDAVRQMRAERRARERAAAGGSGKSR
jgi:UPF0755 protein